MKALKILDIYNIFIGWHGWQKTNIPAYLPLFGSLANLVQLMLERLDPTRDNIVLTLLTNIRRI